MGIGIKRLLTITEVGMLAYWIFATLAVLNIIYVAPEYMYSDYQNPVVVAWNWSFLPIDVMFAIFGLVARFGNLRSQRSDLLGTTSLALMFCAGLMAVSFWLIRLEFDPFWWGINLWLIVLSVSGMALKFSSSVSVEAA